MCSVESPDSARACRQPLEALEREICELAGRLAAATCRWLLLIAEFDEREGWAEWGVRSCAHWLSWRCSLGLDAAREHVRVANRLRELPLIRDAFASGVLSYCKVRALTRVATPEIEAELVEVAQHATGAQLEKLVRGYRRATRATLERAAVAHEQRYLRWSWDDDGSLRVEGRLPADAGALFVRAVEYSLANQAADQVNADNPSARQADALAEVARAVLATAAEGSPRSEPYEVVVHVDVETLAKEDAQGGAEIAGGPAIPAETVRRLGCDAAIVRIIERDGQPLSVGRRRRTIPPALRRALQARDEGCRFPGCTHRRFLHAHHIHHWARGGSTSLDNLVQLCSYHHRLVHEGGFSIERSAGVAVRFRRPDGRLIPAAIATEPVSRWPARLRSHHCAGAVIDADTCRPRSAGDRLDYDHAVVVLCAAQERRAQQQPEMAAPTAPP